MRVLLRRQNMREFLSFLVGGCINTCLTYGVYFSLQKLFYYQVSYGIAYAVGIIFSYWFNATFVFNEPINWKGFFTYPVVYVVQYFVSALLLGVFIEIIEIPPTVGPLLVLILMIPLTFILSRLVLKSSKSMAL